MTLYNHLPLESSLVANARNVAKWVFWKERITNEKALNELPRKLSDSISMVTLMKLGQPKTVVECFCSTAAID